MDKKWGTVWNPVKLVTAPFVDISGTGAWNSMLHKANLVLQREPGVDRKPESQADNDTAVTKFLKKYAKRHGKGKEREKEVEIIGHSMGTIVANNIIAKFPEINFSNIVHMVAAYRLKDLEHVISPYLENNPHSHFYNLSLNAYRDIHENISGADFIPRGSVLMWLDQVLAHITSYQDKTAGFWFNIVRAAKSIFKEGVRERVHLTQFGINDGTPQGHSFKNFGEFKYWTDSFWKGQVERRRREGGGSINPETEHWWDTLED